MTHGGKKRPFAGGDLPIAPPLFFLLVALLILTSLAPIQPPPVHAQISEPNLPVTTPTTARPRLLLNNAYLEQVLRPRMANETRAWQEFLRYVDSNQPESDFADYPVQTMRSLAVAYHLTSNPGYASRATIPLLIMVQGLESHPAMNTSDAAWDENFVDWLTGVAIGYDWLYDTLSLDDRNALVDVMLRAVEILNDPARDEGRAYIQTEDGTYRFSAYDHYGTRLVWALTAVGITLLGEHESATALVEYAQNLFSGWIVPALEDLHGGAWAEGPTFGFVANWASLQTATAFWMALGENYFDNTRWWYDRMPYHLFLYLPATENGVWKYPSFFGDSERGSQSAFYGRAQDMLLSTIYSGTEHAAWMNWFLTQEGEDSPALTGRMAVDEFLWREEDTSGFPPPWNTWFTLRSGHFFMRSAWSQDLTTLDKSAVSIMMSAGDHFATHQFFDSGNFILSRGGDELLVKSGVYSGGFSDHDANYYGRTIAGNTILVCDLAESFTRIRPNETREGWLNDCGQRTLYPNPASAINPYFRQENAATYETGDILRVAQEGGLTYLRADLTAAYNNTNFVSADNQPKVREVLREMVYLRPNIVLVHDRVTPMEGAAFLPSVIFHTNSEPTPEADWLKVVAGDSALYLAGIAPQNEVMLSDGYIVAGETLDFTPNASETDPYGLYHMQFTPIEARVSHFFVTVMVVDAADSIIPVAWEFVRGDGVHGAANHEWQVMFDDDPGNISLATFEAKAPNILITGLQPLGAYRLTLPDGTGEELVADDAGTLYIFLDNTGELRLQQQ